MNSSEPAPAGEPIDFSAPADRVAPLLLGGILRYGGVGLRITEVEAYLGESDAASHAYKGPTPRCATMFGPPARLYVYASYGIHRAGNLVCQPDGVAGGVLLRGGEVMEGHDVVRERRGPQVSEVALARGPGNLGKAMGFDLEMNGAEVRQGVPREVGESAMRDSDVEPSVVGDSVLYFQRAAEPVDYVVGPRIGITKNADAALRFWIPGDQTVSSPRGRRRSGLQG
ncbi:DNA-3-methyladenine glycosylase [Corynebacterium sp. 320]|uniref:DNA-3-methyladenine glycosylase n=1 Tax=Corynebacterium TaxID=1716 RepID=UPI00125CC8B0|nr:MULTISPECIES: DNA-3-methyladenine glycosylase [Corynebacterium]KAB1503144.1 DNA-3-methyladenine glycosylase [Corynebacterium sp. 320]KAB1550642.1 DNA-3-methyladenine glycosylase [Corynebacterium sp. 321]KAB1551004.1 DNA-3-methyladenine glycosylase [Corynebacterium sp. 319]KAB3526941.1 DNA-3-methyladenine glycosylase [Corynebacterium sp. 250]KAB3538434.1 DNA-3-methyladenine glycosylase [Corynebacterium sp. 366]